MRESTPKIEYEYGAMSSRYQIYAPSKLTAYATMILHYREGSHAIIIYLPEDCKKDAWTSFDGKSKQKVDELFGGKGAYDRYLEKYSDEIRRCYKTIAQME